MFAGRVFRFDSVLFFSIGIILLCGVFILFSASGGSTEIIFQQGIRIAIAIIVMLGVAQIDPDVIRRWSPAIYLVTIFILMLVLAVGYVGKGAQRWLDLGLVRFQPAELMKLATPMMIAWLFANAPIPTSFGRLMMALTIVVIPAGLVMVQPDLGTAVMLVISAICAVVLAGIRWRHLIILTAAAAAALPFLWSQLRDYQKDRILAMLDPWSDPLGMGYHTIQAQIAIGSAGVGGKGWFSGSQAHLDFVPERSTDFIFAVFAEEFGFVGIIVLMGAYLLVTGRCIRIAYRAQDHYCRILAGALALTFFFYVFVNVGMVSGILPVVGVPLPLISYGGTSMITLMAAFGIIMGMHRRRRLMA